LVLDFVETRAGRRNQVKVGDFVSVSMDEAIRRLDTICNEKISLETREAFKATRIIEIN
jgi:hypothetical protein